MRGLVSPAIAMAGSVFRLAPNFMLGVFLAPAPQGVNKLRRQGNLCRTKPVKIVFTSSGLKTALILLSAQINITSQAAFSSSKKTNPAETIQPLLSLIARKSVSLPTRILASSPLLRADSPSLTPTIMIG